MTWGIPFGVVVARLYHVISDWQLYFGPDAPHRPMDAIISIRSCFGGPTDLPWGLEIEAGRPGTVPGVTTYHPTFLYESL
ncbi:hypothetical protein [Microbispora bryophytorum]|uniref:hypothetical protein n=1 Tax=Microbispora bryophytorum TaxID=1460882 RepID=UPI003F4D24E6